MHSLTRLNSDSGSAQVLKARSRAGQSKPSTKGGYGKVLHPPSRGKYYFQDDGIGGCMCMYPLLGAMLQ